MSRSRWTFPVLVGLALCQVGCQADPSSWQGDLKCLNVHTIAFTPQGTGLVMVGPRTGDGDTANGTAYYYLHLSSLTGRRLGYGQYSLGQTLLCPFADWVAVPTYFAGSSRANGKRGYEVYNVTDGKVVRRTIADKPELFLAYSKSASSQPADAALSIWEKISPGPLTAAQRDSVREFHPRWISRGARSSPQVKTEVVDKNTFYTLDSPDGKHRLYIRFNAPSGNATKAANPDGEGYAYGFLAEIKTGKRFMLYSTSGTDETLDGVGSAVFGGPIWLIKQPFKWLAGK